MAKYILQKEAVEYAQNDGAFEVALWLEDMETVELPDNTIDVQPVKHAHWIENHDWINCSFCGFDVKDEYYAKRFTYKYCPSCGADLREG